MSRHRSEISPSTIGVSLDEAGVEVTYADGRSVFYHGIPEPAERVHTPPGTDVHVLVTDPERSEGVLVYVNDRRTHDDILRDSGVGRVLLEEGEETTVFPGVRVRSTGYRVAVEADLEAVGGRVFVFAEDERGERSWEIVETADGNRDDGEDGGGTGTGTATGSESGGD